jgi:hypothetical protein
MPRRETTTIRNIALALALVLIAAGLAINWITDHRIAVWGVAAFLVLLLVAVQLYAGRGSSGR